MKLLFKNNNLFQSPAVLLPEVDLVRPKHVAEFNKLVYTTCVRGLGDLGVSVLASGSNPAEDVGFLGRKNPQHAFLRKGSKAVGPMSYFAACKRPQNDVEVVISAKFTGQYSRP